MREPKYRILVGNCLETLKKVPSGLVQCCVTSPPYYGLRDYGTGRWEGGNAECDHVERSAEDCHKSSTLGPAGVGHPVTNAAYQSLVRYYKDICGKCGAIRVDEQIGMEKTSEIYIETMVQVFREVKRVLRDDGTLWLNLGDSYTDGNLTGIPWRVALALQSDGWYLRQDIIWKKPSPMPESITNRCTKSHEYLFLLSKQKQYYYDHEAIKEVSKQEWNSAKSGLSRQRPKSKFLNDAQLDLQRTQFDGVNTHHPDVVQCTSNKRSVWLVDSHEIIGWLSNNHRDVLDDYLNDNKMDVWEIASEGFEGGHFAIFPSKLVEPCILAGTSEKGCCSKCGSPLERVVDKLGSSRTRPMNGVGKIVISVWKDVQAMRKQSQ